jgi:hypothetical protein
MKNVSGPMLLELKADPLAITLTTHDGRYYELPLSPEAAQAFALSHSRSGRI